MQMNPCQKLFWEKCQKEFRFRVRRTGWVLDLRSFRNFDGECDWGNKTVWIKKKLLRDEEYDTIWETLLHEIAHVRAGPEPKFDNHGPRWKRELVKLGGTDGNLYCERGYFLED